MRNLRAVIFLASALALAPAHALRAAEYTWTGAAQNENYQASGNWLNSSRPPANDPSTVIIFTDEGAGTVNLSNATVQMARLVFTNTTASYNLISNNTIFDISDGITLSSGDVTLNSVRITGSTLQVNGPGQLTLNNVTTTTTASTFTITGNAKVVFAGNTAPATNLVVQSARVIISNSNALPPAGKITASGGYVGYTQNFAARFSDFLERIGAIHDPNTIIGIDSATPGAPRIVPDIIDLSLLDGQLRLTPYYIGTTSDIILTGPIKPTLHPSTGYDTLYLAALDDGRLNVATDLGNAASPVRAITIGQPAALQPRQGTVELSGHNAHSEGTRVLGGTLRIDGADNLGTGSLYVAPGATFDTGPNAIITENNPVTLAADSTITGQGTFNVPVTIGPGVNLVPGDYGSAAMIQFHAGLTLQAGANIYLDIGAGNNNLDIVRVRGTLAIEGSPGTPITIYLNSLANNGVTGAYAGFNPLTPYTWTIFYDQGGSPLNITGFNPDLFQIDATAFERLNDTAGGAFNITLLDNNNALGITFTPVPEPGTYALTLLGLGMLALMKLRRRK